jgi:sugar phosphate isomerase/epimerase
VPSARFIRVLKDGGYDGFLSIEIAGDARSGRSLRETQRVP